MIHLAFGADFSNFEKSVARETVAVETFGAAFEKTGKPLVIASGTPAWPGRASTEADPFPTDGRVGGRGRNAQAVVALAERGIRSHRRRLPRSVHSAGGRCGFASVLIDHARRTGVSGYVGDGSQRWPAAHRLDAARLFRLVLEQAAPGTVAHAVADEGDTMRAIAAVIGRSARPAVEAVGAGTSDSWSHLRHRPASSSVLTRTEVRLAAHHPGLLEDLAAGNYPPEAFGETARSDSVTTVYGESGCSSIVLSRHRRRLRSRRKVSLVSTVAAARLEDRYSRCGRESSGEMVAKKTLFISAR